MFPGRKLAVTILLLPTLAAAQSFVATNGAELPAPEIARMTCPEQEKLLMDFSVSGYREAGDVAEDHPDHAIFEYENRLAQSFYVNCQSGSAQFMETSPAFTAGFR